MKIPIDRIFEVSEVVETPAGKELETFIQFCSNAFEWILRGFRGKLTFADNFDATISDYYLPNDVYTTLNITKTPSMIFVGRVLSDIYGVESYAWHMDKDNRLQFRIKYSGGTPPTPQTVKLAIFYS